MRKGALLLAVLMVAAAPTVAFAAKKAAAKPKVYSTSAANMNESSARLVRDGMMQFFVPTQSNMKLAQAGAPKAATAKKAKKGKKAKKAKKAKKKAAKKK